MNKKLKNILIIFVIAFITLMPFYHPGADSGFDGSYSGGSSGGFSGSSWSSSGGSYYGGSYSSGSSSPIVVFVPLISEILTGIHHIAGNGGADLNAVLVNDPL